MLTTILLHMYQIFSCLQGHLHFPFTFVETFFSMTRYNISFSFSSLLFLFLFLLLLPLLRVFIPPFSHWRHTKIFSWMVWYLRRRCSIHVRSNFFSVVLSILIRVLLPFRSILKAFLPFPWQYFFTFFTLFNLSASSHHIQSHSFGRLLSA